MHIRTPNFRYNAFVFTPSRFSLPTRLTFFIGLTAESAASAAPGDGGVAGGPRGSNGGGKAAGTRLGRARPADVGVNVEDVNPSGGR